MAKKRHNYKPAANTSQTAAPSSPTLVSAPSKAAVGQAFNPDYSDIIKDLKRIGFLAVSFFVILVALSFFIH